LPWSLAIERMAGMKDGIYRVDFKVGDPTAKGIAMLSGGVLKGVDQTRAYAGQLIGEDAKISGFIEFAKFAQLEHEHFSMGGGKLLIEGREEEDAFEAIARYEADPSSDLRILGTWVSEL
jgi:hypothetical protein